MKHKLTKANINTNINLSATILIALVASFSVGCDHKDPAANAPKDQSEQPQEEITPIAPSTQPAVSHPVNATPPVNTTGTANATGTTNASGTPAAPKIVALVDDGGFLKLSDLEAPAGHGVNILSDVDLVESLRRNTGLYNVFPSMNAVPAGDVPADRESVTNDSSEDCLKPQHSAKWVANKLSAKLAYAIDTSECEKKKNTDLTYNKYTSVVRAYMYLTCEGGDLSAMNGKTQAEIADSPLCPQLQRRFEFRSDVESDGVNAEGIQIKTKVSNIVFMGSKDLGGCKIKHVDNKQILSDDCIDVTMTAFSTSAEYEGVEVFNSKTYDLEKLSYKGVVDDMSSQDNIWHESGSIDIEKNNWAGTITYAGSKVNPTYDAWANLEMISGVLAPADGE
ncbi:MAG: hypothetical protein FJ146_07680 [Deltaproteobacteria bacterium]|nr:hypothetical protein [Deltaproteobacteria bacterium]